MLYVSSVKVFVSSVQKQFYSLRLSFGSCLKQYPVFFMESKLVLIMANGKKLSPRKQKLLNEIIFICNENIRDPKFGVLQLAIEINVSERQLYRIIQDLSGVTPHKFIREIKLQKAKEIIENGSFKTISQIASAVGFERTDYFSKLYASRFGVFPREV